MNHWLLKTEPSTFGVEDLAKAPRRTSAWDGVRNYQARNMLRDTVKKGDLALLYHSSCEVPGVAGIVEVVKAGYPDVTAFDARHHHYDPDSDADDPTWYVVDVKLVRRTKRLITLAELREHQRGALSDLILLRRGNRLSVMPLTKKEWDFILTLE